MNSQLPSEILQLVASSLPLTDILRLCSSNRRWARVCQDDFFWKQITLRDFPHPLVKDEENWKEVYQRNLKLSQTPIRDKFFYVVISEPFNNSPNFLGLRGNTRILYLWLRNYLHLRNALNFSDITLETKPDSFRFDVESQDENLGQILFEYQVSFPHWFVNQLQVEQWFETLKLKLEKEGSGRPELLSVSEVAFPLSPMRTVTGSSENSDGIHYIFFNPSSAFIFDSDNRLFLQGENDDQPTQVPY